MAGIGTKPSQLANPVPHTDDTDALLASLNNMPMPQAAPQQPQAASAPATAATSDDDLLARLNAAPEAQLDQTGVVPDQNIDNGEDLGATENFLTRLRYSFATNKNEERGVLENKFGGDNVKEDKSGNLLWRRNKDEKFKRADSESFTVGDLLDLARPATELLAGGVAGLAAGAANPILGGIAAGAAGQAAGDAGASLLGVERKDRNALGDYALAAGAGGAFEGIASGIKAAANYGSGKEALKVALSIDKGAITDESKQVIAAYNSLKEAGVDFGKMSDGKKLGLTAADFVNDPELRKLAKMTGMLDDIEKLDAQRLNAINANLSQALDAVSPGSGKAFSEGVNYVPKETGKELVEAVDAFKKQEGKIIGTYKELAGEALSKDPVPSEQVSGIVDNFVENLGITKNGKQLQMAGADFNPTKLKPEQLDHLTTNLGLGLNDANKARTYTRIMNGLAEDSANQGGKFTFDQVESRIQQLGKLYDGSKSSPEFQRMLAKDLEGLRGARNSMIEGALGDPTEFKAAMGNYSKVSQAVRDISALTDAKDYSTRKLITEMFTGTSGYEKYTKTKSLLEKQAPEVLQSLKDEMIQGAMLNIANKGETISAKSMQQELTKLDPRIVNELFSEAKTNYNINTLNAAAKLSERFDKAMKASGDKTFNETQKGAIIRSFNALANPIKDASTWLAAMTQKKAVKAALGDDAILAIIDGSKFKIPVKTQLKQQWASLKTKEGAVKLAKEAMKRGAVPVGAAESIDQMRD